MKNEISPLNLSHTAFRVDDFICWRCGVQAAEHPNSLCELCKAMGKNVDADSETGIWSDIRFGGVCAKRFLFGLGA